MPEREGERERAWREGEVTRGAGGSGRRAQTCAALPGRFSACHLTTFREGEFFIDYLLVRINKIIVMIRCTGLATWEFEVRCPGSLTSTCLIQRLPFDHFHFD